MTAALAAMQPIVNPDTFGHLAQGRVIAERGWPPALDPFSFFRPTPQPWPNYEWLSDLITYGIEWVGGWNALIATAMTLAALAAAMTVALSERFGGRESAWLSAIVLVLALPAARFRLSARPHLVTVPLALLFLWLVGSPEAFQTPARRRATVATLFVAQVLWANLHGSHLLGIAIVGLAALLSAREPARAKTLGLSTLAVIGACAITPFGPTLTLDAVRHVFDPAMRNAIREWHDITTASTLSAFTIVTLALATIVSLRWLLRGTTAQRISGLLALVMVLGALRSLRFVLEGVLLASLAVGLALGSALERRWPSLGLRATRVPIVVAASGVAALLVALDGLELPVGLGLDTRLVPAESAAHVAETLPEARVLGSMPTGWYTLWGAPTARVLLDGRTPFYGPEHVGEVTRALATPALLPGLIDRYDVDTVILQRVAPDERAALPVMEADPRFVRTWIDVSYSVYMRRDRVRPERYEALAALPSTLDAGAITGADDARVARIREGLGRLGPGPDAQAFAGFVRAMLRLRPLSREGGWSGYEPPATEAERDAVRTALAELEFAIHRAGPVPTLTAQAMLAATLACRLDRARELLAETRVDGDVRETIFGEAEIALRDGDIGAVRAFLDAARGVPGATDDGWYRAIASNASEPPRCPP